MTESLNDSQTSSLLARFREGDASVVETLFSIHRERLRRMVRVRLHPQLRSRVGESDVLQDSLLKASQQLQNYLAKPEMPFFVWLRWITSQQIKQCHRFHLGAAKRDARKESRETNDFPLSHSQVVAEQFVQSTPSKIVAREELVAIVMQVLDAMKTQDREVLSMRHIEQMSNPEVAATLGVSESNASTRYVRALARLQKELQKYPGIQDGQ